MHALEIICSQNSGVDDEEGSKNLDPPLWSLAYEPEAGSSLEDGGLEAG